MASTITTRIALALAIIAAICLSNQFVQAEECSKDRDDLVSNCMEFVKIQGPFKDPSATCCGVVKRVNVPCVCKYVTAAVEKVISMKKVVQVAAKCGSPLKRGTKCGSYIVQKA